VPDAFVRHLQDKKDFLKVYKDLWIVYSRMMSFVNYVLLHKEDNTALGDVARDINLDRAIKKSWSYRRLIVHLIHMNAVERIYQILEEAKIAYTVRKLLE
jgi:hypothetical protein